MISKSTVTILYYFYLNFELAYSCLPTQQIEEVTTTTSTTTTTTTTTTSTTTPQPYPCVNCPEVYLSGCLSGLDPEDCLPASEVGITYLIGPVSGYGDSDTCSLTYSCPAGYTALSLDPLTFTYLPAPATVIATCQQTTGSYAGTWYQGIPPDTPQEISETVCAKV